MPISRCFCRWFCRCARRHFVPSIAPEFRASFALEATPENKVKIKLAHPKWCPLQLDVFTLGTMLGMTSA